MNNPKIMIGIVAIALILAAVFIISFWPKEQLPAPGSETVVTIKTSSTTAPVTTAAGIETTGTAGSGDGTATEGETTTVTQGETAATRRPVGTVVPVRPPVSPTAALPTEPLVTDPDELPVISDETTSPVPDGSTVPISSTAPTSGQKPTAAPTTGETGTVRTGDPGLITNAPTVSPTTTPTVPPATQSQTTTNSLIGPNDTPII